MKGWKIFPIVALACISLAGACAPKKMYYWGGYSESLYNCKKNPCDESFEAHRKTLEDIIAESQEKDLRIPPGVCAELGWMYMKQNNTDKAIHYFRQEEETYPEARVFVQRLIKAAELREEPKSSNQNEQTKTFQEDENEESPSHVKDDE